MTISLSKPGRVVVYAILMLAASVVHADQAQPILDATGVKGGLIVHIGCGDGKLTAALHANDRYLVCGLDEDASVVDRAREHIQSLGLYGKVSVNHLSANRLPFAENMVNLLVSEDLAGIEMDEVMRALVPNGVAYIKQRGEWSKKVKPWPDEIDEWTHWLHGPDGNAVAADTVVGPPRHLKWMAKPFWSRHHNTAPNVTAIVSAQGRLFYIVDEAPASMDGSSPDKWVLVARDAFNGIELWRKPLPDWGWKAWSADYTCRFTIPTHIPKRLVAVGDHVYATLGFNAPLSELDAATGKVLRTFEGTAFTDEILCLDGQLILSINQQEQEPGPLPAKDVEQAGDPPVGKWVAAIDAESGRMLWKKGDYVGLRSKTGSMERISHLSMVAGDGAVFFVDAGELVALDLKDGGEKWRVDRPQVPEHKMRYNIRITDMCSLVYNDGLVFFAQLNPDRKIDWREIRGRLHVFSADTGKELWNRQCSSWGWGHPADVLVLRGLVWVHDFKNDFLLGLDPGTGQLKQKMSNHEAFDNGHHHRCYRNKATEKYMITSYRGLEFIDWDSGRTDLNHWVRGTCRLGPMPCNGMIYASPHPCDCYITSKLNGFLALAPAQAKADMPATTQLIKGPAHGSPAQNSTEDNRTDEWPTYRHDMRRSGSTLSAPNIPLKKLWQRQVGGEPTGLVICDGRVYVASQATHRVWALDAGNGKPLWHFTAGGRIDTPPTAAEGTIVFGCTDGWVYCLRASDGQLIWRFRAAPQERLVGAFGGLESAWPVHGSVLVDDGKVYFTAGRSSFLDGGIIAYCLDVESGKVISRRVLKSPHTMKVDAGRNQSTDTGLLSDVLVGHQGGIYMRQQRLFGEPEAAQAKDGMQLHSTAGLLDDTWFSRTRWFVDGKARAEYLVFDDQSVYGIRARPGMSTNGGLFKAGSQGYQLFAAPLRRTTNPKPPAGNRKKTSKQRIADRWIVSVPVRVSAMVAAGDTLFVSGAPDVLDPDDAWASYEGRKGGRLIAFATADGKKRFECKLEAPPVLDGLAPARRRLYISQVDGNVVCLGADR